MKPNANVVDSTQDSDHHPAHYADIYSIEHMTLETFVQVDGEIKIRRHSAKGVLEENMK
jgi:hypothetical protein